MGCDIHIVVEKKTGNQWKRVADKFGPKHPYSYIKDASFDKNSWSLPRSYSLFAMLAGVRNDDVKPISEPKGFPKDASAFSSKEFKKWAEDAHTPSYLTLKEILAVKDNEYEYEVPLDSQEYEEFKAGKKLTKIKVKYSPVFVSNKEMDRLIKLALFMDEDHVTNVAMKAKYSSVSEHFWEHIVPAMEKLTDDPDKVRIVFWFDS